MEENLRRFREPASRVVLVATVVLMLVDLVRLGFALVARPGLAAFEGHGLTLFSPVIAMLLVLAVGLCVLWSDPVPDAAKLARRALWVAAIGTGLQFCCGVLGLVSLGQRTGLSVLLDAVGYLALSAFPVLAVVVLAKMVTGMRREREREIESTEATVMLRRPRPAESSQGTHN